MKTRRMVQALYGLLGCEFEEYEVPTGRGSGFRTVSKAALPTGHAGSLRSLSNAHIELEKLQTETKFRKLELEHLQDYVEREQKARVYACDELGALLEYLGLETQDFPAGVRIVKTKKAKGTKRA